ncbi:MAG: acyl-CoA thioesterase [Boseongicola sp. SB0673_bin_14]|nr:acyl-CoA thioesterase [Boseongicola sp. SB0667_bin_21]MYI68163.1 acyl-CoA thioesterase [Boseongicola sp. SB0673_bin_14]
MFTYAQKVLFKHCDPAGIVFYPRYFEMMNDCVEAFFADVLKTPFEDIHKAHAVPTAQITTRFAAPSRHGDQLALSLSMTRVGRTSADYAMSATCEGEIRFETTCTLVYVNSAGRPTPWPESLKSKLSAQLDLRA